MLHERCSFDSAGFPSNSIFFRNSRAFCDFTFSFFGIRKKQTKKNRDNLFYKGKKSTKCVEKNPFSLIV